MGIPIFGEQSDTVARAVDHGLGLALTLRKLSTLAADLEVALHRVLTERSFAAEASRVSMLIRAHRQTPAQVAAGTATDQVDFELSVCAQIWHLLSVHIALNRLL